jgi:hypothetical protein
VAQRELRLLQYPDQAEHEFAQVKDSGRVIILQILISLVNSLKDVVLLYLKI